MTQQRKGPISESECLCCVNGEPQERPEQIPHPVSQLFEQAQQHHERGRLSEAKEIYRQILEREPEHPDALHYLGLIAHQTGRSELAAKLMARAIEREPGRSTFFLNLGQVLEAQGELDAAIENYKQAASLDPQSEAPYRRLGDVYVKAENLKDAAVSYSQALNINPTSPEAINSLGTVLQKTGRLQQSAVCFAKAVALKPDFAEAYNNLGTTFDGLGLWDEAVASFHQAIDRKPGLAPAYANLGKALLARNEVPQAIESLQRAIELQPGLYEAYTNLGNAYRGLGQISKAIGAYRQAITIDPNRSSAYNNLADICKEDDRLEEAVAAFEKALAVQPKYSMGYSNLLYLHALTRDVSPEAERVLAEGWEKNLLSDEERFNARKRAPATAGYFSTLPRHGRKLRLGIVSCDLGDHPVAEFLEPLLEQLDRKRFHLTLFPACNRTGARAERLRALADSNIPVMNFSDVQAAEKIRSEQIDVLMDTSGHTSGGGRLGIFAHRAAPVQFTYIGYWSTTGLTEMDWFFGDPYFDSPLDAHFTEGIWRLPRLAACYRGDFSLPESHWSPDPDGTIWLGSFNKYAKIRRDTLRLWAKVLCAIPQAKLLLEDRAQCEDETHERILGLLAQGGVARNRVEFVPCIPGHLRHMVLYDRLDVALDTIPFNSGTTAFDALWMGVPLVALEGKWSGGRMGAATLKAFDHPQWVARDEDEYASIVRSLALDVDTRRELRKTQRSRMAQSPLCDSVGFARSLEEAFEGMYDRWLAGGKTSGSGSN